MRRNSVLAIAFGLAICAGVLPLLAAYYISRERAFLLERRHLPIMPNGRCSAPI